MHIGIEARPRRATREREKCREKNSINNFARAIESRRWTFFLNYSKSAITHNTDKREIEKVCARSTHLFIPLKLFCDCITPPLLTFRVVGIIWVCLFGTGRAEATHGGKRCPPTSRWRTVWWCFGRFLRPPRLTVPSQSMDQAIKCGESVSRGLRGESCVFEFNDLIWKVCYRSLTTIRFFFLVCVSIAFALSEPSSPASHCRSQHSSALPVDARCAALHSHIPPGSRMARSLSVRWLELVFFSAIKVGEIPPLISKNRCVGGGDSEKEN